MSSGFFSFFAHTGFLSALEEDGLLPVHVSGSSAGALVGGSWAAGLSAETLSAELLGLQRRDFWDPGIGFGLLRGRLFEERLRRMLPVHSFEACRVKVTLSVYDVWKRTTTVCDAGDLPSGIVASCTVPLMFHPKRRDGRTLLDGGIADRPGLLGIDPGTRTLFHHIASRSPWRSKSSVDLPVRENMHTLILEGLPRSGPFRLDAGRRAFHLAREATRYALDGPVGTGVTPNHTRVAVAS
jgi:NTE family protein